MDRAFLLTSSSEQAQAQQSAFVDSAKSAPLEGNDLLIQAIGGSSCDWSNAAFF